MEYRWAEQVLAFRFSNHANLLRSARDHDRRRRRGAGRPQRATAKLRWAPDFRGAGEFRRRNAVPRRIAVRPACAVAGGVRDEAGTGTVVAGRHARRVLRRFGGADRTQARRGRDVRAADRGGQVAMSLILEHYGWIGFPNHPLGLWRMVGGALLIMRVVLVVRS